MIPRRVPAPALFAALTLSIAAPSPSSAAWPHDPGVNVPVCTTTDTQYGQAVVSDGSGGAFLTWHEYRGGADVNIYVHHVLASGIVDPAWPVNGLAICTAPFDQASPAIVLDGARIVLEATMPNGAASHAWINGNDVAVGAPIPGVDASDPPRLIAVRGTSVTIAWHGREYLVDLDRPVAIEAENPR